MTNTTCPECRAPIVQPKRGRQIYCSKACANRRFAAAWRTKNRVRQSEYFDRTCIVCNSAYRSARATGKFCSDVCKGRHYSETKRTKSKLPDDHPVMVLIAAAKLARHEQAVERRKQRDRVRSLSTFEWAHCARVPGLRVYVHPALHLNHADLLTPMRAPRWQAQAPSA